MTQTSSGLPVDFTFGVATAAYQIEGAAHADGRGPSIWDTFSHTPGRTYAGDTGDLACDHYHRYAGDVALMQELGVDAYRFSIAWPRIQPDGRGAENPAGIDFYSRLVDALLEAGIEPFVTLYHWDLPQPLQDDGGWPNRDTAARFAEYASIVHRRLGDRVRRWITLNEPFCSSFLGYASGRHAPGIRSGHEALAAAHHLLLGHGLAAEALRDGRHPAEVGVTLNLQPVYPASDAAEDVAAAERALCQANLLFTDPVLLGRYPESARSTYGEITDFSYLQEGDLQTIGAPLDFLGVNYYFPSRIRGVQRREPDPARRTADDIGVEPVVDPDGERTEMGWPVDPNGLFDLLTWLHRTYPELPPIYITENGRACADELRPADGKPAVEDPERIRYLSEHLGAVARASASGVDVRGYFCWSLLDNFEWAEGYSKRFGLLYTDYPTQRRIPKASFGWFRDLVAEHHRVRAGASV